MADDEKLWISDLGIEVRNADGTVLSNPRLPGKWTKESCLTDESVQSAVNMALGALYRKKPEEVVFPLQISVHALERHGGLEVTETRFIPPTPEEV